MMIWVICSHCNTCKSLSGAASTLNTIIPESDFKLTKGELKHYTYKGDSGTSFTSPCYRNGV